MIKIIIVDLDGPLLDVKSRHYECYKEILLEHGHSPMPVEKYWEMKRNRRGLLLQLAVTDSNSIYDDFSKAWSERIEDPTMLVFDRLQPGVNEKLIEWRKNGIYIILATMRRFPERLNEQLNILGIKTNIDSIVICDHNRGGNGKAIEVKNAHVFLNPKECLWIGDTEEDMDAARYLKCSICLVTAGIRTGTYLASLNPDFLYNYINEIENNIFA